jgi:hypothetical protein
LFFNRARTPIQPEHRLVVTLRFLASGAPYRTSLQWDFCIPHNTLSGIIEETCVAISREFKNEAFNLPRTPEGWREKAQGFSQRWNFEHCLGALDGKHVAIRKPKGSGSLNYNYKGFCSIVLLGVVDADYKFMWVSVGEPGSSSDGGIWKECGLYRRVEAGTQGIPAPEPLPGRQTPVPWFFVGDAAFAIAPWMQKPFPHRGQTRPERIFNYRFSRARRIVENSFGILVMHWRCLTTTLGQAPKNAVKVVTACVTLHNLVRERRGRPQPGEVDRGDERDGAWRENARLHANNNLQGNRPGGTQAERYRMAINTRNYLRDYYSSPQGAVHWQDRALRAQPRRRPETGSDSEID